MIGCFQEKLERRMLYSHVREEENGISLLEYMSVHFSRFDVSGWEKEILAGNVEVNRKKAQPASPLKKHDLVVYFPPETPEPESDLAFRTVYQQDGVFVFDKLGNLCVHPTGPFFRNTLWHLAGEKYGEIRFVNRLDRETSGLLVGVDSPQLAALIDNGKTVFHKEYLALVIGRFQGELNAKGVLVPDTASCVPKKKKFIMGGTGGEEAATFFREIAFVPPDMTLVRAIPRTGRQHQIRVTLHSLGFPMVGDKLYGPDERLFLKIRDRSLTEEDMRLLRMDRQALHSALLEFRHPVTGKMVHCESEIDFVPLLHGKKACQKP